MNIWYFPINWWFNLHFCTTVACMKKWVEYPKSWPSWPLKERTLGRSDGMGCFEGDQPGCLIFGHVERVWPTSDLKASPDTVELCWTGISSTPLFLLADFQRMFFSSCSWYSIWYWHLRRSLFPAHAIFFYRVLPVTPQPIEGYPNKPPELGFTQIARSDLLSVFFQSVVSSMLAAQRNIMGYNIIYIYIHII